MTDPDQAEELSSAHGTARQRAEAGDLTGARTMLEDALAAGELRLGRDDPRLAPLMVDLATLARKLGNLTEARNQLRRAYAIVVAAAGPEHATALSIEGRLAAVIYRLGEPTEAYDWHLSDAGQRVLGTDHPAVRGAQQRLEASAQNPTSPPAPPPPPINWTDQPVEDRGWAPPPDTVTYTPVAAGIYQRQAGPVTVAPAPYPREAEPYPREAEPYEGEAWPEPDAEPDVGELTVRRRGHGGGVALVASLGVVVLVAAGVVALQFFRPRAADPAADPTPSRVDTVQGAEPPSAAPTPTAAPPTAVVLKDDGGSVTLTWLDPSNGRVPFIVSGGRDGQALIAMDSVEAGRTTSTIYGLNDRLNYCFTVSAVWASDKIAPSMRTCTNRPTPSTTT